MQKNIFGLLTSKELFRLRAVCGHFCNTIKGVWCHVVKDEMLDQVTSLDLLYEKETTSRLLEFKLKYLISYATLMNNYFVNMNLEEIVGHLISLDDPRGTQLLLVAALVVSPSDFVSSFLYGGSLLVIYFLLCMISDFVTFSYVYTELSSKFR